MNNLSKADAGWSLLDRGSCRRVLTVLDLIVALLGVRLWWLLRIDTIRGAIAHESSIHHLRLLLLLLSIYIIANTCTVFCKQVIHLRRVGHHQQLRLRRMQVFLLCWHVLMLLLLSIRQSLGASSVSSRSNCVVKRFKLLDERSSRNWGFIALRLLLAWREQENLVIFLALLLLLKVVSLRMMILSSWRVRATSSSSSIRTSLSSVERIRALEYMNRLSEFDSWGFSGWSCPQRFACLLLTSTTASMLEEIGVSHAQVRVKRGPLHNIWRIVGHASRLCQMWLFSARSACNAAIFVRRWLLGDPIPIRAATALINSRLNFCCLALLRTTVASNGLDLLTLMPTI